MINGEVKFVFIRSSDIANCWVTAFRNDNSTLFAYGCRQDSKAVAFYTVNGGTSWTNINSFAS